MQAGVSDDFRRMLAEILAKNAAAKGVDIEDAIGVGLAEKSAEFRHSGASVYLAEST